MSSKPIVQGYVQAWMRGDFDEVRGYLSDDISFRDPINQFRSPGPFLEGLRGFYSMFKDGKVLREMYAEKEAFLLYECALKTTPKPFRCAEYFEVSDGKIKAIELTFDATVVQSKKGTFCWNELATSEVSRAREFYSRVFDWTSKEVPMPTGGTYVMFQRAGAEIAGIRPLMPQEKDAWSAYVLTDRIEKDVAAVEKHGGRVLGEIREMANMGKMAFAVDPQGAFFALWQEKKE